MRTDKMQEDGSRARLSSWLAALSQLPGFPEAEKPKLPQLAAPARTVSPVTAEDES
jgi:hypothetical protein